MFRIARLEPALTSFHSSAAECSIGAPAPFNQKFQTTFMKKLTILAIRILALFVLIRTIFSLEFIPSVLLDEHFDFSESWFYFLNTGLYIILSGVLFLGSERIADFMTPKSDESDFQIDNYQKFSAVIFSSIGLLIIYWSIQSIFQSIGSIVHMNTIYPDNPDMRDFRTMTILFGGIIQLIIGILLFVGGKKLAKWWNDFRNWT